MKNQQNRWNIDYTLLFIVFLLAIVSLFTLYTIEPYLPAKYANQHFLRDQAIYYVAGGILILLIMWIDYDRFRQITWSLYTIGIVMLLMLALRFPQSIVIEANGAWSWLAFPGIGTIQPAEFMKIFLVLALAHIMYRHHAKFIQKTKKSDLWLLAKMMFASLPPMGLIMVQPDLGSALILASITACMILVSGIRWRIILTVILSGVGIVILLVAIWYFFPGPIATFLEESVFNHVSGRFYGWLHPEQYAESGYQLIYAMLAIGSGQLFGKGMNTMEVYVPEKHTDMIFTAVAEQFGFIGASVVVTLFFLLIYRMIHIALKSND